MDITELGGKRFELGIECFIAGFPISYEGVVFVKEPIGALVIASFSEFVHADRASPSEAVEKIARSKLVMKALAAFSPDFATAIATLPSRYEFRFDYGMGAIILATEESGAFTWRGAS